MAAPLVVAVHADRLCYAEALAEYLGTQRDIRVFGFTSHWSQTERWCNQRLVDIAVVDIAHYSEHMLARLRRLRRDRPSLRIVVTCEHVPVLQGASLRAIGVAAVVRYRLGLGAVPAALHAAVTPAVRGSLHTRLTGRELEVLRLISPGHRVVEIAKRLGISSRTVENHKRHIYHKLDVSSREGAVSRAMELGLLTGADAVRAGTGRAPPSPGRGPLASALTRRERDILTSIAQGDSVRQTARTLGVAEKTVQNLQSLLYRKLGVHNRTEALAVTIAHGLMAPSDPDPDP